MHIRDRLRKGPRMPKVLRVILPLSVWFSHRILCDPRPAVLGLVAVGIRVFNTNTDRVSRTKHGVELVWAHFPHDHRSISHIQLHAVAADAQTHTKSECITKPSCSLIHIWIRQNWNNGGAGYRSVRPHLVSPSPLMMRAIHISVGRDPPTCPSRRHAPRVSALGELRVIRRCGDRRCGLPTTVRALSARPRAVRTNEANPSSAIYGPSFCIRWCGRAHGPVH